MKETIEAVDSTGAVPRRRGVRGRPVSGPARSFARGPARSRRARCGPNRTSSAWFLVVCATSFVFAGTGPETDPVEPDASGTSPRAPALVRIQGIYGDYPSESFHAPSPVARDWIDAVLTGSPELVAAAARVDALEAAVPSARALPDPMLGYQAFAAGPETRVGPQRHALEFRQTVPWRGKRAAAVREREHRAGAAAASGWALARRRVAAAKRAFHEVRYLERELEIVADERALLERFEAVALERYANGEGLQQAIVRVQTELTRLADRELEVGLRRDDALREVARLAGDATRTFRVDPGEIPVPDVDLDRDALGDEAVETNPGIDRARRALEAERASLDVAELARRPDFDLGAGYTVVDRRDDRAGIDSPPEGNGDDIFGVSVRVRLPVRKGKIRAEIGSARHATNVREAELESFREDVRAAVFAAVDRFRSAEARGRLHADVLLPQAEASLASAEDAYASGRLDFADLLEAERVLIDTRRRLRRLEADAWIALTDLELWLGRPFPDGGGS